MISSNSSSSIQIPVYHRTAKLDGFLELLQMAKQAPRDSYLGVKKVESNGHVHLKFKRKPKRRGPACLQEMQDTDLVDWAIRQLIGDAISEVKTAVPTAYLQHLCRLVNSPLSIAGNRTEYLFTPMVTE